MHGMHRYAAGGSGLPLTLYRPDGIGFFADPGISAATFSKLKRNVPVEHPQGRLLCLDKGNPRLCRGTKRAYSEGWSRQEKVSKLE